MEDIIEFFGFIFGAVPSIVCGIVAFTVGLVIDCTVEDYKMGKEIL